jgi:membrane protein
MNQPDVRQEGDPSQSGDPAKSPSRPAAGGWIQTLRAIGGLFQETLETWGQNTPDVHAAAIAFATLFSLAPLVMLVLVIVGQAYEQQFLDRLIQEVASRVGRDAADLLGGMVDSRRSATSGYIAAVTSFIVLVFSAGGLIGRLRASLNTMWNLTPRPQSDVKLGIYIMVKQLVVPAVMVLGIGLALFALLTVNTLGSLLYDQYVRPFLGWLGLPAPYIGNWPAPLVNLAIFAVMYKMMPQARIRWRDVFPGAALTALLFWLGNFAIKVYLTSLFTASVYGAAGSIIVVLLWVNYSALIVLFGAQFIYVYAKRYGVPIIPNSEMMFRPGTRP